MSDEFFNLERAEQLLPELDRRLHAALAEKKRLTEYGQEQARIIEGIMVRGGSRIDPDRFRRCKRGKEEAGERLREMVEEIEGLGCFVKDLDIGLVDFPSRANGRDLYLCWKLGEPRIQFWHYVEEGFAGRKPLDDAMIREMQRFTH